MHKNGTRFFAQFYGKIQKTQGEMREKLWETKYFFNEEMEMCDIKQAIFEGIVKNGLCYYTFFYR